MGGGGKPTFFSTYGLPHFLGMCVCVCVCVTMLDHVCVSVFYHDNVNMSAAS